MGMAFGVRHLGWAITWYGGVSDIRSLLAIEKRTRLGRHRGGSGATGARAALGGDHDSRFLAPRMLCGDGPRSGRVDGLGELQVAPGDELEEEDGATAGDREVADLVDDQERRVPHSGDADHRFHEADRWFRAMPITLEGRRSIVALGVVG